MGYDGVHATISASLSCHGDIIREGNADIAWSELVKEIGKLCDDPRFEDIRPFITANYRTDEIPD